MPCTIECLEEFINASDQELAIDVMNKHELLADFDPWHCDDERCEKKCGRSVLHEVVAKRKNQLLQFLYEQSKNYPHEDGDFDIDFTDDNTGNTLLHEAVLHGNLDTIKQLIGYGANVHVENKDNKKPIDVVAQANNHQEIVEYFEQIMKQQE